MLSAQVWPIVNTLVHIVSANQGPFIWLLWKPLQLTTWITACLPLEGIQAYVHVQRPDDPKITGAIIQWLRIPLEEAGKLEEEGSVIEGESDLPQFQQGCAAVMQEYTT